MPLTAESAAQQIQVGRTKAHYIKYLIPCTCFTQDRLKDIQQHIHKVDAERRRAENSIASLVRAQQGQVATPKMKTMLQSKILEATQEEATIRAALAKIHEIRNIRNERRIQVSLETFYKFNECKQKSIPYTGAKCWQQRSNSSWSADEDGTAFGANAAPIRE